MNGSQPARPAPLLGPLFAASGRRVPAHHAQRPALPGGVCQGQSAHHAQRKGQLHGVPAGAEGGAVEYATPASTARCGPVPLGPGNKGPARGAGRQMEEPYLWAALVSCTPRGSVPEEDPRSQGARGNQEGLGALPCAAASCRLSVGLLGVAWGPAGSEAPRQRGAKQWRGAQASLRAAPPCEH